MKHSLMSLNMKPITVNAHNQVAGDAPGGELVLEMRRGSGMALFGKSRHLISFINLRLSDLACL